MSLCRASSSCETTASIGKGTVACFFHVTRDGAADSKAPLLLFRVFRLDRVWGLCEGAPMMPKRLRRHEISLGRCLDFYEHPEMLPAKFTNTRPGKGIGAPMILMNVAQQLRETIGLESADQWIDRFIDEIRADFVKPEIQCVMEQVAPDGSIIDHFDGRTLNPGHAIECAWFILHEGQASQ